MGYVVALIIGLPFLYREVIQFTTSHEQENLITITKQELSYFLNYGLGVTIINLCSQGLSQIDRFMAGLDATLAEVTEQENPTQPSKN